MKLRLSKGLRLALLSAFCVATTLSSGTAAAAVVRQVGNLPTLAAEDTVTLRWDSSAGEPAVWDEENTAVWTEVGSGASDVTFTTGSQVQFGEGADLNKEVQIGSGHVTAFTVEISGSDYCFSGGEMVVTDSLIARESATIDSALVMGSSSSPLTIEVAEGKVLTTNKLGTPFTESNGIHNHTPGSFRKIGGGTLSVTGDVPGLITEASVQGGKLELGAGVSMDVGANIITGGTLENVEMLISGEVDRPVSGGMAVAHNLIKSADGKNAAVLTDVTLHAGSTTEYATLQNVSFAGESTLQGYITFEKTQRQGDMSVAAGGTLMVDHVCFDLHGLASGEKVLIENAANGAGGTLSGWDTVSFVYSGIAVNSAAVESSVAGTVTIKSTHDGNLYWTGAADEKWNPGSANWSAVEGGTDMETFTSLSNVYFGAETSNRDITVTQDLVVMNLGITDGGYSFSGGRVATLGDAALNFGQGTVTFHDQLVIQGNLTTSGAGSVELLGATTVVKDMTLNAAHTTLGGDVSVMGKFTVNAGTATDAGSLTISGNVTAQEMNISVSAGEDVGNAYNDALVNVTGDLSVGESGQITIGGTAEQHYLGVVKAGTLTVNTQEHDVYFDHLHVNSLTVGKGAHVHVQTSSAAVSLSSSTLPDINLSGTLALDAYGTTYDRGYKVYVQDDAAALSFGTGCTIGNMEIYGKEDGSGYTDLSIAARSRSATVEHMENLGNLSVRIGSVTVKDSTGAVHGTLSLDNGKLNLAEGSDNLMAAGSGAINLENGSRLNIGSTTQTLSADNSISLSSASSITGDAEGPGLQFADGASIYYAGEKDAVNSISANMVVDHTLTVQSKQDGSSLDISGKLSGSGDVQLSGAGTVAISGANSFSGMVTVGADSTLSLQNAEALTYAGVTLSSGGTLSLDTDTAVYLNSLTFNSGSTLSFSTIYDTDEFSVDHAALHVADGAIGSGTLNISFSSELNTMRTYNLMTGLTSSSFENLTLNVTHNGGVALDASQYKLGFDAESGLLYMQTLMGNVWEAPYGGGWSTDQNDPYYQCWSGGSYYNQNADYPDAIFGDLSNKGPISIDVDGVVSPGNVHFVADTTEYIFVDEEGWPAGQLAAGTNIHKDGGGDVTLGLEGNQTAASALGDVDIQSGKLTLVKNLAVQGKITVDSDAQLVVRNTVDGVVFNEDVNLLMESEYTVSGMRCLDDKRDYCTQDAVFSGVTLDADGISGAGDLPGRVEWLQIEGSATLSNLDLVNLRINTLKAKGNVELTNATLYSTDYGKSQGNGYYQLYNVTIGEDVAVDETGCYYLSGNVTFKDTLVNKGVVYLSNVQTVEIGQINYEFEVDAEGRSTYTYTFIDSKDGGRYDGYSRPGIDADRICINGIRLQGGYYGDCGLADGIDYTYTDNKDGSVTLSIGNGTVGMPQWDERWGKMENAPGISRRYAGQDADAYFVMAAGGEGKSDYYMYHSIVNETNAAKVNDGKAIVVTLSSAAVGKQAAGGAWGATNADHEVWIYDRSGIEKVIGGQSQWVEKFQSAATHILVNVDTKVHAGQKHIVGGSYDGDQYAESFVTVQSGNISYLVGGSEGWYTQTDTAHVYVDGGTIDYIYTSGYNANMIVNQGGLAAEMNLYGGTIGGAFGGVHSVLSSNGTPFGTVTGDIYVRMDGAEVTGHLVGGSDGGTTTGNIVMDLISGSAAKVHAAGLGWNDGSNNSIINGDVLVNLYSDFQLGKESEVGALYGGKEKVGSFVSFGNGYTSTLHFAEAGEYTLGTIGADGYTASDDSVIVTGFDRISLTEGAHAVVALGKFDRDMDASTVLHISGKGIVEVIGHGENFGRDILLTDGATLKVATSVIGLPDDVSDDRTIMVKVGTTLDITGYPVESDYAQDKPYAGLGFKTEICGDGVDNMGAIYKGAVREAVEGNELSVNKVSLPSVTLTGNASAAVMDNAVLHMNSYDLKETHLDLNEYTFTKKGLGTFVARNVQMTEGTVLVHQGDIYFDKESRGVNTDMVMASGTALYLNSTNVTGEHSLSLRTLSGAGRVILNDAELTLHTTGTSTYEAEYMDDTQSYDQFMDTTGFAHAVFSGTISDGDDSGRLGKTGEGVHYISGSNNTYSGGTRIYDGRLYLLGTSAQSEFVKGASSVASGVAGKGSIIWSGEDAELYLGHDARIYNDGTVNVQGGVMTIGVEGAPNGVLADFIGSHSKENSTVKMGDEEYVEIETHNLKSIAVNAEYADGTDYVAGAEIDRNKMLLVKKSDWETAKNTAVTGFSDNGYNEAIYSGVLRDSNNVAAKLHKEGVGTLVLDQSNTYTGGTEIEAGTLRVRGWGTLGENEKANSATVQEGATLMFTHNSGYGNEPTSAANDITIKGSGDARWLGQAATDGDTAALISAVGPAVTFTLSGDISGSGNVRHSGEGVLVLNGDSSYKGGTYVSRGTVEVQSATGLGATASGQGTVTIESDADLRVTVEDGYTGDSMVTTLAADVNDIQGDVTVSGTAGAERVLHMDGNGYKSVSTTLNENGTLLLNGAAINGKAVTAESELLTGRGKVVVSDASASGASMVFDSLIDYTGDFRVEGDKAAIKANAGTFIDGSIHVAGKQASVSIGSDVFIADGESLELRSTGNASEGTSAAIISGGTVSVEAGAKFSVRNQATEYAYDISDLEASVSLKLVNVAQMQVNEVAAEVAHHVVGEVHGGYDGRFDAEMAINQQAVGSVQAAGGLTLDGGATYETVSGNTSLNGGKLTLETMEHSLLTFNTTTDAPIDRITANTQLVLFSNVGGVDFGRDSIIANPNTGIYYTMANRYLTGCDYIDGSTLLVYDSRAEVVYLQMATIPEPTTTTLSLLALAALASRRRRK